MKTSLKVELKPNYSVELVKVKRSHFYKVIDQGKEFLFPGVTRTLAIIGGEKTQKLIGWAKKESLNSVSRELLAYGATPVLLEPDVVEGIIARARKKPVDVLDSAGDYGPRMHEYADKVIKGEPLGHVDDDLEHSVLAFKSWMKESGIEIILGDTAVASLTFQYGGKFDAVFVKDGKLGVLDFKTSSGIREEYALQVAAYAEAARETYNVEFPLGLIVRFDKTTPTYETAWVKDMYASFRGFTAAQELQKIVGGTLYA